MIIKNDVVFNINKKEYNISKSKSIIQNLLNYDAICVKWIIYKLDYNNWTLVKVAETKNKKNNSIFEVNWKFYVPKKWYTQQESMESMINWVYLEKNSIFDRHTNINLYNGFITPEQIEKYLDEITF